MKAKSTVNSAGVYTKPTMRKSLFSKIKALSPQEYAATTRAKREGTKAGKQFVKQPKSVAKKVAGYR